MTITESNLIAHELIGLNVSVTRSSDPTKIGLSGTIRDETKNTLTIESRERLLTIPKSESTFSIELPDGKSILIEGSRLRLRPEDRVKRRLAHW